LRRALAAGLLALALAQAAQGQAPPEAPAPADTPPASPEAQPPESTPSPSPAAERPPAKPAAPKAPKTTPPAPSLESTRDAEVAALRAEVSRLQSELDAERAAAVPPPAEEAAPAAPTARSPWGWLVATALLALAGGFLLGWRLLDRRIRARYGGLRIY
jgi:hypothetical protein